MMAVDDGRLIDLMAPSVFIFRGFLIRRRQLGVFSTAYENAGHRQLSTVNILESTGQRFRKPLPSIPKGAKFDKTKNVFVVLLYIASASKSLVSSKFFHEF